MKSILTLFILVLTIASCKKAEEAKSIHDDLRAGRWRLNSGSVQILSNGTDTTYDYLELRPDCVKDDYLVFTANFSGYVYDDTAKCGVGDPQEMPFTWELKDKDTRMNFYNAARFFGTSSVYGELTAISAQSFTIRYSVYRQDTPGSVDTLMFHNSYSRF